LVKLPPLFLANLIFLKEKQWQYFQICALFIVQNGDKIKDSVMESN